MKKIIYIVILIGLVSCSVENRAFRKAKRMTIKEVRKGYLKVNSPVIMFDTLR